jgi:MYXO-CTERM domain-containing protein
MKTLSKTLAALCLAAAALAAHAEDLRVTVTSNFTLPPLTDGVGSLSIGFDIAEPLTGVIAEGDLSFRIVDIGITANFNGIAVTSTSNQVGWFNYADQFYYGIDIRLRDLLVPGDLIQLILATPVATYSGTTSAPALERLSLSGLQSGIYYYGLGSGAVTAEGLLTEATYNVSAVPEPAAALMLPLGLLLIAGVRRRRAVSAG